jgi:histidinol-phosphatase (PHP family)
MAAGCRDYHLHTRLCGHAVGEMEEYLAAAARAGLVEVGFADHLPQYFLPPEERDPGLGMGEAELPGYVEKVLRLRESAMPVQLKLSIEADYMPGYEEFLVKILERYPFDYVLGSVHYIDGWGFDNPDLISGYARRNISVLYEQYFSLVQAAARTGLFDVMAHPDLIKKFGYRPEGDIGPLYEETAQIFAGAGVCVEVNTAGLRVPAGEIYPAPGFLAACRRRGVPVTLGSDAHRPEQVGVGLEEAMKMVRGVGYDQIACFAGRKMELVKI